jgi:hypothetical protein
VATYSNYYIAGPYGEPLNSHGELSVGVLKYPFQFVSRAGGFEQSIEGRDDLVAALRRHSKAPGIMLLEADIEETAKWAVTQPVFQPEPTYKHCPVDESWYIY